MQARMRLGWLITLLIGLVPLWAACDAGPSMVMPVGSDRAAGEQTQPHQTVGANKAKDAHVTAPQYGAKFSHKGEPRVVITRSQYGDWPLWSENRKYTANDNAHYHFEKHGPEFGARSYTDYVVLAHGFVHAPPQGTQTLKRSNGDTVFYDAKDNIFAVMTKAGAPRTLFRPNIGAAYWQQQKHIEATRRTLRRDSFGSDE